MFDWMLNNIQEMVRKETQYVWYLPLFVLCFFFLLNSLQTYLLIKDCVGFLPCSLLPSPCNLIGPLSHLMHTVHLFGVSCLFFLRKRREMSENVFEAISAPVRVYTLSHYPKNQSWAVQTEARMFAVAPSALPLLVKIVTNLIIRRRRQAQCP